MAHRMGGDRLLILMATGDVPGTAGAEPRAELADSVGAIGAPREISAAGFRSAGSQVLPRVGDRHTVLLGDGRSAEAAAEALIAEPPIPGALRI